MICTVTGLHDYLLSCLLCYNVIMIHTYTSTSGLLRLLTMMHEGKEDCMDCDCDRRDTHICCSMPSIVSSHGINCLLFMCS
jgi:hypothetical protein